MIEVQERIARARRSAGATDAGIEQALNAAEPHHPETLTDQELVHGMLTRFVAALGGRIEGDHAVFPEHTIPLSPRDG